MPDLVEVGKTLAAKGGRVLLVNYDLQLPDAKADDALLERVRAFLQKRGFAGDCLVLRAEDIPAFEERYGLGGSVPETVALDASGLVVELHAGKATRAEFEELAHKIAPGK